MNFVTRPLSKIPNHNFLFKLGLLLMLLICSIHSQAASLCGRDESIVFACDVAKKRSIAVCAGVQATKKYLEYRYGTPNYIEMRFRSGESDSLKEFHFAEVLHASNASEILWFQYDGLFYLIHLPMRGGPVQSTVRDGKPINSQTCRGGWGGVQGNINNAKGLVVDHGSGDVDTMARHWGEK